MTDEQPQSSQDTARQLHAFVASEMKAGSDKSTISRKVQEMGMDRSSAEQAVDRMYRQIVEAVAHQQFVPGKLLPALAGAVFAALIGGAVWAGIVIVTDYELGIVAWGIGGLCGYAVVLCTGGRRGLPLQVIAVLASLLGIVAGKYFTFYFFLRSAIAEQEGAEAAASLPYVSPEMLAHFVRFLTEVASPYDALWVVLAVITAWRIPRGSGIRVPAQQQGPISG